jgi:hypothetical protein
MATLNFIYLNNLYSLFWFKILDDIIIIILSVIVKISWPIIYLSGL